MAQQPESAPEPQLKGRAAFILHLSIVVYLLAGVFFFVFLTLDAWSGRFAVARTVFQLPDEFVSAGLFRAFMFSATGGGLGGILYSMLAFHRHVSVRQDFHQAYAWGFFLSPWVASVLGGVVFALVQGGLLVFAGATAPESSTVADLGYLGLGFLSGFGWNAVTEKLRQLINQLFGGPPDRLVRPESAAPAPAPPPAPPEGGAVPPPAADRPAGS